MKSHDYDKVVMILVKYSDSKYRVGYLRKCDIGRQVWDYLGYVQVLFIGEQHTSYILNGAIKRVKQGLKI